MTSSLNPPGWYPDPAGAAGSRYWDGHNWGAFVPPGGVYEPSAGTHDPATESGPKASVLTVAQGISLLLLGLVFGYFHAGLLPNVPTRRANAPELVDTIWRTYFLVTLTLCVVSLILGILCLARPEAHPKYSVIAGTAWILTGLAGCYLGFLSVGNGDDMGTPTTYLFSGFGFACAGAVITALSVGVLVRKRSSQLSTIVDY